MSKLTRTTRVGRGISHHPVCLCEVKKWSAHDAPTRLMWSSSIVRVSCQPPSWLVLAGYFILVRLVISHQLHPSGDTDYLTCEITPELHPLGSTKRQDRSALHGSICSSRLLWWFATVSRRLARSGVAKKQPPGSKAKFPSSPDNTTTRQLATAVHWLSSLSHCTPELWLPSALSALTSLPPIAAPFYTLFNAVPHPSYPYIYIYICLSIFPLPYFYQRRSWAPSLERVCLN